MFKSNEDTNKSDLYFINCIREVLGFAPLHQGKSGDEQHLSVAKRARMANIVEDLEMDELAEVEAFGAFV
jgi:hypothetical protein